MAYYCSNSFSTINNTSISVASFNFAAVVLKAACYAIPGAERNFSESNS